MVVAADLTVIVMVYFAAAFDYGNLDSSFGCSYFDQDVALPLNEYCLLVPLDGTYQDVEASYHHLKQFVAVIEVNYYTFHHAYQDAPFSVGPSCQQVVDHEHHLGPFVDSCYPCWEVLDHLDFFALSLTQKVLYLAAEVELVGANIAAT